MSKLQDKNIPTKEICQELIDSFMGLTGVDAVVAQFYLQNSWNLELALDNYFELQAASKRAAEAEVIDLEDGPVNSWHQDYKGVYRKHDSLASPSNSNGVSSLFKIVTIPPQHNNDRGARPSTSTRGSASFNVPNAWPSGSVRVTTKPPEFFRFLSWNIDGLDDVNLKIRMKAVVKIIIEGRYDIVHLQEVIPKTQLYLEENLPEYMFIAGDNKEYYAVTLLRITTVHFDNKMIHKYPNSMMGRNLLEVEAHIGNMKMRLLNTHLESTAEFSEARKVQLKNAFGQLVRGQQHDVSLLAGDLNIRDKEVQEVGIPYGSCDLWIECGMRKECQFTWDLARNTNKSVKGKFIPRCRFDRAFLYQSKCAILPVYFGLEGIQKIADKQVFPSDHWGIQVHFKILDNSTKTNLQQNSYRQMLVSANPLPRPSPQKEIEAEDDVVVLD